MTDLPKPKTSLSTLEGITLVDILGDGSTFKANKLWSTQPALIMVVRRPGCRLCREEAVKLATLRDVITNKLGVNMHAVVHERLDNEVEAFNDDYWKGDVYLDKDKSFFKAIGGGAIQSKGTGTFFNPTVWANVFRSRKVGVNGNFKGDGSVLGGLYVIHAGSKGIAYEYHEKTWGDHAPTEQFLSACEQVSPRASDPEVAEALRQTVEDVRSGKWAPKHTPNMCQSAEACGTEGTS